MNIRTRVAATLIVAAVALAFVLWPARQRLQAAPAVCGGPVSPGAIGEPPSIAMASLPLDDLGRHELVLHVRRDGQPFCYNYTFNGAPQHVAPVLRVHRGERFALRIVNDLTSIAPGGAMPASALAPCKPQPMAHMPAREYVGYLNHTIYARAMSTKDTDVNIHLHGFEGPASQENVFLSTLSTPAHACEFDITIPRTQPPGTYFYHPHAHGMAEDEVAGGLGGMWIVEPDAAQLAPADDHPIIVQYRVPFVNDNNFIPDTTALDAASVRREAGLRAAPAVSYDPFAPPPWPSTLPVRASGESYVQCGNRTGLMFAVNGTSVPAVETLAAGKPQLLRILNGTSDSLMVFRIHDSRGRTIPMHVVGRDGIPIDADDAHPLAKYESLGAARLVPMGRIDVLLTMQPGQSLMLHAEHHCVAPFDEYSLHHDLVVFHAGMDAAPGEATVSEPVHPEQTRAAALIDYARSHRSLVRRRAITYSEYALMTKKGPDAEYYLTDTTNTSFHEKPYWPAYAKGASVPQADVIVKRGTVEEWYLFNTTLEEHSFHIHQMAFVAEDERPMPVLADTVLVPVGKMLRNPRDPDFPLVKPSVTRVLLDFRNVPRGTFVFHCHMLFHEDHGMMAVIRVE